MSIDDKEYLDARFADFDAKLDSKLDAMKQLIDARFNELRAEMHQTFATTVKWCAGLVATGLLLYTTMLAFLMNNAVPRAVPVVATAPAPAAAIAPAMTAPPAPQPIVIVVPLKPWR